MTFGAMVEALRNRERGCECGGKEEAGVSFFYGERGMESRSKRKEDEDEELRS
jgi:hypothetical protein